METTHVPNQHGSDGASGSENVVTGNNVIMEKPLIIPREDPNDLIQVAVEQPDENEDPNCPVCREEVKNGQPGMNCDQCKT